MRIAGLILAGGQGRRMGGAKAFAQLGGRPLIAHVHDRMARQVQSVHISANDDPADFAGYADGVLHDDETGSLGPLSGILQGLRRAGRDGFTHVASAPVDTPFLPANFIRRLSENGPGLVLASSGGRLHPACALWPVSLADAMAAYLAGGGRRLLDFTAMSGHAIAVWRGGKRDPFFNINTPDDLAAAEMRLSKPRGKLA